eukprot:GDKJ01060326.1.p1 GENE.GDKJ01060326.1~~GDKJ01060326.1.p1  ORF type:complete len:143 (-),score=22.97 GDKJ01060326.1:83-511(-)
MIRFILAQNRAGKTRLSKWYVPFNSAEKNQIETEIHRAIVSRSRANSNIVEYRSYKLVYRQYMGMLFIFCVDVNENELSIFELINMFVETLDHHFGRIREVDLVYHFDVIYHVLDSIILAGEISTTSHTAVLQEIKQSDKLV